MDMASDILQPEGDDMARTSWNMRRIITKYQETFSVIEKVCGKHVCNQRDKCVLFIGSPIHPPVFLQCPKPVVVAVHSACIGGGQLGGRGAPFHLSRTNASNAFRYCPFIRIDLQCLLTECVFTWGMSMLMCLSGVDLITACDIRLCTLAC